MDFLTQGKRRVQSYQRSRNNDVLAKFMSDNRKDRNARVAHRSIMQSIEM